MITCAHSTTNRVYTRMSHLHPLHNLVRGKLISSKLYTCVLLLASVLLASASVASASVASVKASAGGSCDSGKKESNAVTGGEGHDHLHPFKQDHLWLIGGFLCLSPQPPPLTLAPSVHLAICNNRYERDVRHSSCHQSHSFGELQCVKW